jgi:hypothetical protein
LFEGSFDVVDNFLGENVGLGKVVGVFKAFVSEPEDVRAGLDGSSSLRAFHQQRLRCQTLRHCKT